MAVLKRRTRMVNFRLFEDEYEGLRSACLAGGVRSISDFARAAVCRSLVAGPRSSSDEPLHVWVRTLDGKVQELDRAVKSLTELVVENHRSGEPSAPEERKK